MIGSDKSSILGGRQLVRDGVVEVNDLIIWNDGQAQVIGANDYMMQKAPIGSHNSFRVYRILPTAHNLDRETTPMPTKNVCQEAEELVLGDRNSSYGNPADDYAKTAKVWSGLLNPILKRDITPQEAMLMMVGLKLSREVHKHKHDNIVDAIGYLLCVDWSLNGKPELTPCNQTQTDLKNSDTTTTPKSCGQTCENGKGCCENGANRTKEINEFAAAAWEAMKNLNHETNH